MTCTSTEWTLVLPLVATIAAAVSAIVALFTVVRTLAWQIPTVEFLIEYDEEDKPRRHKLTVSNPTRRLLVLDYIDVLCPDAEKVRIEPSRLDRRGMVSRSWEQLASPSKSKRKKPVFLAVKPGETADLKVEFDFDAEEDFAVDFRFCWSKSLRGIERWCIPKDLKLDSGEVWSRTLAAIENPKSTSG